MSLRKTFFISTTILCFFATGSIAQTSVSRDVTVEREFNPTAVDAKKINTIPKTEEFTIDKKNISYSISSTPIVPAKSFNPLATDTYKDTQLGEIKNGVFRVGIGSHWQTIGDFYYPLLQGDSYLLDFNISHQSAWGKMKIAGDTTRTMYNSTRAGLTFENQFRNARLVSGVHFTHNGFDYYGISNVDTSLLVRDLIREITSLKADSMLEMATGSYTQAGALFKLFSTNQQSAFQHNSEIAYQYFSSHTAMEEHNFRGKTNLNSVLENGRIGVAFDIDNYFYKKPSEILPNYLYRATEFGNTSVIKLSPYYVLTGKNWDISLGASLFAIIGETQRPVSGAANITGKAGLIPDLFYLYGGIVGDIQHNSYSSMMKENKYISPDVNLQDTYTPLNIYTGLKLKVMDGLLFDGYLGYKIIRDQYFFVNRIVEYVDPSLAGGANDAFLNTFDVTTEKDASLLTVDLCLLFDRVDGLDISVSSRYNKWNVTQNQFAWHKPTWEISVQATYKINNQWSAGIGYNFMGDHKALVQGQVIEMNDVHDINANVSYKFNNWLHVFGQVRNAMHSSYDTYYGYKAFGINGLIGASFTF